MAEVNRRDFIKKSIIAGTAVALLPGLVKGNSVAGNYDICAVTGADYFQNTINAIELLGGINKFVPRGSKVGLLHNAPNWWSKPGSHTSTEVVLALLKLLNDAGAKEIVYLIHPSDEFYKRSNKSVQFESITKTIKTNSGEFKEVDIQKGISLKKAMVIKDLFDCDVFINVPVNKHHAGTQFSNCLKNFMGNCHRDTNKFFHSGSGAKDNYEDVEFLSQCIADVNLIRKPDLCISDATEILKTNGPAGPGEIMKPMKVYAGNDPVAMDAYGSTILDLRPEDVRPTVLANKHGIGRMDIKNLNIKEISI
jgi:uncharacterized protein (DUF362 family)